MDDLQPELLLEMVSRGEWSALSKRLQGRQKGRSLGSIPIFSRRMLSTPRIRLPKNQRVTSCPR